MKTQEMCREAIKQDGRALEYVPEEMKTQELFMIQQYSRKKEEN